MIQEIALIDVKEGMEAEFEKGVAAATPLFKRAAGCHGARLLRSIEKPRRYRLVVDWETVEAHTVGFRGSEDFKQWRALVGHCFETPPEVEHVVEALRGF
jgi:heme-degrading monooxygenase HmoA